MRKNRMMRLASALLILTMVTTCAISGTFAKYVTSDSGTDTARVAKFGVVVEAKGLTDIGMFKTDYETTDTAKYTGTYSVSSATGDRDDVLAPGTSGSFANIKITGTPEVAVGVSIVSTVTVSDKWVNASDKFYCPVTVTVGGTTKLNGLDYESAAEFAAAIKAEIDGKSAVYAPNTNLAETYDTTNLDLAWAWAFENATGSKINQNDTDDTFLGDAAVAADLDISIGVAITVTQID